MVALAADADDNSLLPQGLRGIWYFVVTLASFGALAWVPFAHASAATGSRLRAVQSAVYATLATVAFMLITIAPTDPQGDVVGIGSTEAGIGGFLLLGLMGAGCLQQIGARQDAYRRQGLPAPVDPAVAAVLAARDRRAKARDIVAGDPMMAHELRIGRPDLQRTYDDGGLVDLNAASARAIAKTCELDPTVARAITEARAAIGGFLAIDDVFTLAEIPLSAWPMIREHAVVITL